MCATNDVSISPIRVNRVAKSRVQEVDFATVPFGTVFSDHMFSTEFQDGHWSDSSIEPYGPISVTPSITALHYGISFFEGMKAHKSPEGRSLLFGPRENARARQGRHGYPGEALSQVAASASAVVSNVGTTWATARLSLKAVLAFVASHRAPPMAPTRTRE